MQKELFNSHLIGLDKETKRKISIILQGTSLGPGVSYKLLNFLNQEEIERFIVTVNRHFEGILQFVQTQEKIVPIIINPDAYESKRRAISNKAISVACIILLHEFSYNQGLTFDVLEQKLQSTSINTSDLRKVLRELKRTQWLKEIKKGNIDLILPTTVLKACISLEMLEKILEGIKQEGFKDINLESILPDDYLELRKKIKTTTRQLSINDTLQNEKNGEEINE